MADDADEGLRRSKRSKKRKQARLAQPSRKMQKTHHPNPAERSPIISESVLFKAQVAWLRVLDSRGEKADNEDIFKSIISIPDQTDTPSSANCAAEKSFPACTPENIPSGFTSNDIHESLGREDFKEPRAQELVQALVAYQHRRLMCIYDILSLDKSGVHQLSTCWSKETIIGALVALHRGRDRAVVGKVVDVATLVAYGEPSTDPLTSRTHLCVTEVSRDQLLHNWQFDKIVEIRGLRIRWRLVHWAKVLLRPPSEPLQTLPSDHFEAVQVVATWLLDNGCADLTQARMVASCWMFAGKEHKWPRDPPDEARRPCQSAPGRETWHDPDVGVVQRALLDLISPPDTTITDLDMDTFKRLLSGPLVNEYKKQLESLPAALAGGNEETKGDSEEPSTRPSVVRHLLDLSLTGPNGRQHLVCKIGPSSVPPETLCRVDQAMRVATAYNLCRVKLPSAGADDADLAAFFDKRHLLGSDSKPENVIVASQYSPCPTVCTGPMGLPSLHANSDQLMASVQSALGPSCSGRHFSFSENDTHGDAHRRLLMNTFSIVQASMRSGCQSVRVLSKREQDANYALGVAGSITSCAKTVLQCESALSEPGGTFPTNEVSDFAKSALALCQSLTDFVADSPPPTQTAPATPATAPMSSDAIGNWSEGLAATVQVILGLHREPVKLETFEAVQTASQDALKCLIQVGGRPKPSNVVAQSVGQHSELFVESMLSAEIDSVETMEGVLVKANQSMWFFTRCKGVVYAWKGKPDRLAASENGIFIGWFHEAKPSTTQDDMDKLVVMFTAHMRLLITGACAMPDARKCLMELFDLCPVILTMYSYPLLIIMEGRFHVEFPAATGSECQPATRFSVEVVAVYDTTNLAHKCVATCHMDLLFKSMRNRMVKHKEFLANLKQSMGTPTARIRGLRTVSRAAGSTKSAKATLFFGATAAATAPAAATGSGSGSGRDDAAACVPASDNAAKTHTLSPISIGGASPLFPQFHSFEDADKPACAAAGVKVQVLDPGADHRVYEVIGAKDEVVKVVPRDEGGSIEAAILQHLNSKPLAKAVGLIDTLHILSAGCECVGLVLARVTPLLDVVMSFSCHEFQDVIYRTAHAILEWHRAGVYHRDVKPSNLGVKRMGLPGKYTRHKWDIVILDASLSAWISPPSPSTPEEVREHRESLCAFVGTDGFTAPEVGQSPFTSASDVYSLGATIRELVDLTGLPVMAEMLALARDMMVSAPEARPTMIQVLERITAMP